MAWIDALQRQVVALDTAPLIYFIEENSTYLYLVSGFFQGMEEGHFRVVTSVVTLMEVLVRPLRQNDVELGRQYRDILLDAKGLTTVLLNTEIAEEAAALRAEYNVRLPDAIQMATAVREGASLFLTNDHRLPSLPELQMLKLDELLRENELGDRSTNDL